MMDVNTQRERRHPGALAETIDALLGSFKLYRWLRDGRWYRLRLRSVPHLVGWYRRPPEGEWENLEVEEDYG